MLHVKEEILPKYESSVLKITIGVTVEIAPFLLNNVCNLCKLMLSSKDYIIN